LQKGKTFNLNPFDKKSILEGKKLILLEAKKASLNYKTFLHAAIKATGYSERTIKSIIYQA